MRTTAANVLLWVSVLNIWLAVGGFTRLRTALDRLHCVTFVNAAGGGALFFAVLAHDGFSVRLIKLGFLLLSALVGGAVLSHATGRALWIRERRP